MRRVVVALALAGWSTREIAAEVDRSVSQVNRVRQADRQREAEERKARRMLAHGSRVFDRVLRRA